MRKFIMAFVLAVSFAFLTVAPGQAAVAVGEQAPDFTAQDTNGDEHSLSAYKGKFIVLEWFNHQCPFVKKHYDSGNMQKLQKMYMEKDVVWLSICSSALGQQGYNEPQEANSLAQEKGTNPTAIILDSDGTIGRMYEAATTPHMFIINAEGTLIYQGAIDDIPGTELIEIVEAKNYVQAALKAAFNGEPVDIPATKPYGCSVKY